MEDKNVKKLSIILLLIFVLVIGFVIIVFGKSIFGVNKYEYYLPKSVREPKANKEEVKYQPLLDEQKIIYNEKLNDKLFLIPLANAIINNNLTEVNLVQSDKSKFIYTYTYLSLKENSDITFDLLNEEVKNIFGYNIDKINISEYLTENDTYTYNYNEESTFCLKAKEAKEDGNKLYLKFDYLSYDDKLCNTNEFNYTSLKEGEIIYHKLNDKYYIDSFEMLKKEG